jgi:hypothetical protein
MYLTDIFQDDYYHFGPSEKIIIVDWVVNTTDRYVGAQMGFGFLQIIEDMAGNLDLLVNTLGICAKNVKYPFWVYPFVDLVVSSFDWLNWQLNLRTDYSTFSFSVTQFVIERLITWAVFYVCYRQFKRMQDGTKNRNVQVTINLHLDQENKEIYMQQLNLSPEIIEQLIEEAIQEKKEKSLIQDDEDEELKSQKYTETSRLIN